MGPSGTKLAALAIATTTSDVVNNLTRPGNKNCEALKITKKHGYKITIDQKAMVGKAACAIVKSGSRSP